MKTGLDRITACPSSRSQCRQLLQCGGAGFRRKRPASQRPEIPRNRTNNTGGIQTYQMFIAQGSPFRDIRTDCRSKHRPKSDIEVTSSGEGRVSAANRQQAAAATLGFAAQLSKAGTSSNQAVYRSAMAEILPSTLLIRPNATAELASLSNTAARGPNVALH